MNRQPAARRRARIRDAAALENGRREYGFDTGIERSDYPFKRLLGGRPGVLIGRPYRASLSKASTPFGSRSPAQSASALNPPPALSQQEQRQNRQASPRANRGNPSGLVFIAIRPIVLESLDHPRFRKALFHSQSVRLHDTARKPASRRRRRTACKRRGSACARHARSPTNRRTPFVAPAVRDARSARPAGRTGGEARKTQRGPRHAPRPSYRPAEARAAPPLAFAGGKARPSNRTTIRR